ncbi:MAG: MaoC family dehydratase [Firmicutes bacterium]|nr:MaoC family dehydratase [Bacillota bacterium]
MLAVGESVSETYLVDADLVQRFADAVSDFNPLHLDPEAAAASRFGRPIAHGTLIMSFISGLLGQRLPGPGSVYLVQHSEFRAPVYVGDRVTVSVTVEQVYGSGVARLSHEARVGDRLAVSGYSDVLLAPKERGDSRS